MKVIFHPDAEIELEKIVAYYESSQNGLGLELADEVLATIARILDYPQVGSLFSNNTRRCVVKRFPYGIIYQICEDAVRIIAVAHLRRRPGYWENRM